MKLSKASLLYKKVLKLSELSLIIKGIPVKESLLDINVQKNPKRTKLLLLIEMMKPVYSVFLCATSGLVSI